MDPTTPEVVTLCGSTRFRDAVEAEQRRLTLEGRTVIRVNGYVGPSTRGEIEHARARGVTVTHLEP